MKLDINVENNYFVLDYTQNGTRLTHFPTGETLRKGYDGCSGKGLIHWEKRLLDYLTRHANAHLIVNTNYEIVGDANDYPHRNGGFAIGDTVVTPDAECGHISRQIIRREEECHQEHPNHPKDVFVLDDGSHMFWDSNNDGWFVDGSQSRRARKPLRGENVTTLEDKLAMTKRMGL